MMYGIERIILTLITVVLVLDVILEFIPRNIIIVLLIGIIAYYIIRQLFYELLLWKYDGIHKYIARDKYVVRSYDVSKISKLKREYVYNVIFYWIMLILTLYVFNRSRYIDLRFCTLGMYLILIVNEVIFGSYCFIRLLVAHSFNKRFNCILDNWSFLLLITGMLILPTTGVVLSVWLITVVAVLFIKLLYIEYVIWKHPYRLASTRKLYGVCSYCSKRCLNKRSVKR